MKEKQKTLVFKTSENLLQKLFKMSKFIIKFAFKTINLKNKINRKQESSIFRVSYIYKKYIIMNLIEDTIIPYSYFYI